MVRLNLDQKIKLLVSLICILIATLIIIAVFFIRPLVPIDNNFALKGVSVSGIDISRMTREEALAATEKIPKELLKKIELTIDFNGETVIFTAQDLGLVTDYEDTINQALAYGHSGNNEERKQAADIAKKQGKDFTVNVQAVKENIRAALLPLNDKFNIQPIDASYTFMPRGYLLDGTAYKPDEQSLIESCANGEEIKLPDLARIPENDLPNKLRYEYWKIDHYAKDYIPNQADISRFLYKDGTNGQQIDMEVLIERVISAIKQDDYSVIEAPIQVLEPKVKLTDLKYQTQLVSSWTSSYASHAGNNRNWNVAKLSGIINGVIIQPGEEWSINEEAGERTLESGWLEAAGIELGGYTPQAGGGVCQISSTLYNAAIRSNLDIAKSTHHSISSDYIPLGLDATISSGGPDLKIKNPYDTPVFIVSYVNPEDENVTVEIYGPPVVDPEYGEVILDFSFIDGGTFGTPGMDIIYNTAVAPDRKAIAPGASYVFAQPRPGRSVQTFMHTFSLDGEELKVGSFNDYKWNPSNGKTYVNSPDPLASPSPTPVQSVTPTPSEEPSPTETDSLELPSGLG